MSRPQRGAHPHPHSVRTRAPATWSRSCCDSRKLLPANSQLPLPTTALELKQTMLLRHVPPRPAAGTSPDERGGGGFLQRCPSGSRSSRSLTLTGRNAGRTLDPRQSLLVASEPLELGTNSTEWRMVPCNTMITAIPRWRDGADAGKVALRADLLEGPAAWEAGAVRVPPHSCGAFLPRFLCLFVPAMAAETHRTVEKGSLVYDVL